MLFNSIDFAVFLPIVFILYWFVLKQLKQQNLLIVVASYVFYGWWDWRFLFLIFFSSIVDFIVGLLLLKHDDERKRKILLWISITVNLSILGFFKYYNFFVDNFVTAFSFFGHNFNHSSLNIILPVGISFYTFQTLSYSIDVYKNNLKPTKNFIAFSAFVSFFPQLVAGPIERASNLLPQFYEKRKFNYASSVDGLRQILWGFFKKIVIADNCATYANLIFNDYSHYSGIVLIAGAVFFTFQIYGDFSGYSDIAIGTSKLFGFNLMQNFAFPYFSRDIAEFWRRWHISLSTWFRDYLYIPLGGSKNGKQKAIRNTFIIFIVSGFWHGANWTFIAWGFINALYFLPLMLTNKNRRNIDTVASNKLIPSTKEFIYIIGTFMLTVFGWIFFRSENISQAFCIIQNIFSPNFIIASQIDVLKDSLYLITLIAFFLIIEWIGRSDKHAIEKLFLDKPKWFRWGLYSFLIFLLGMYMQTNETPFIYFQF